MDERLFLFFYAKNGKVRALTHDEASDISDALIADGYKHTTTISAREWIQHIANDPAHTGPNIQELREGLATNTTEG